jgi:hypothetical protein
MILRVFASFNIKDPYSSSKFGPSILPTVSTNCAYSIGNYNDTAIKFYSLIRVMKRLSLTVAMVAVSIAIATLLIFMRIGPRREQYTESEIIARFKDFSID